jgi:hypothetical protein
VAKQRKNLNLKLAIYCAWFMKEYSELLIELADSKKAAFSEKDLLGFGFNSDDISELRLKGFLEFGRKDASIGRQYRLTSIGYTFVQQVKQIQQIEKLISLSEEQGKTIDKQLELAVKQNQTTNNLTWLVIGIAALGVVLTAIQIWLKE